MAILKMKSKARRLLDAIVKFRLEGLASDEIPYWGILHHDEDLILLHELAGRFVTVTLRLFYDGPPYFVFVSYTWGPEDIEDGPEYNDVSTIRSVKEILTKAQSDFKQYVNEMELERWENNRMLERCRQQLSNRLSRLAKK